MSWCSDSSLARLGALVLTVFVVSTMAWDAYAQQLEPRSYTNTPIGMNFLIGGFGYGTGSAVANPSIPLTNADINAEAAILGFARSLDVWGTSGKIDVLLPYTWLAGSAELAGQVNERSVSGFGDPAVRFSVNLYGAPALSLKEFQHYKQDLIVGVSLQVLPPLGQYDSEKLVNVGANRWTIKPEIGASKALGRWTLELAGAVAFYTDNDDFLGGNTRSQDPLYSLQAHVIYSFESGIWAALDGTYYTGGDSSVNGVANADRQNNSRMGLTVALPVDRHNSVKFYGSTALSASAGGDFDAFGLAWQYRWGGGL